METRRRGLFRRVRSRFAVAVWAGGLLSIALILAERSEGRAALYRLMALLGLGVAKEIDALDLDRPAQAPASLLIELLRRPRLPRSDLADWLDFWESMELEVAVQTHRAEYASGEVN